MKTYRCPYCGCKDFEFKDVKTKISGAEAIAAPAAVQVECCACHWVGDVDQLGGNH